MEQGNDPSANAAHRVEAMAVAAGVDIEAVAAVAAAVVVAEEGADSSELARMIED